MAYEKLNLTNGTIMDAEHVAHMESGIEAAHEAAERNSERVDELSGEIVDLSEAIEDVYGETIELSGKTITAEMAGGGKIEIETSASGIVHTGKNLFEVGTSANDYWRKGAFKSVNHNEQTISLYVEAGSGAHAVRNTPIPVKAGDSITISTYCDSHDLNVANVVAVLLDANKNVLTTGLTGTYIATFNFFIAPAEPGDPATFYVSNESAAYILPGFRLTSSKGIANGEAVTTRVQCEFGDAVTKWEAGTRSEIAVNNGLATFYAVDGVNTIYAVNGENIKAKWKNVNLVRKVNGYSGNVVLTAEDVGAMPADYTPPNNILTRNEDVLPLVKAAARYGHNENGAFNTAKQLTMLVMTDLHHNMTPFQSATEYMDAVDHIDFGVCLGDMMNSYFTDNDGLWLVDQIKNRCRKKLYPVIGNHDAGNTDSTATSGTKQQQFDKFFAPVLTKLDLTGLTKTYYSVNTDYGVTMIVLDCHDVPDTLSDDATFAVNRKQIGYSQAQVDWLIATLNAVPAENHVIIAVHNTLDPATMVEGAWTQTGHMNEVHEASYDYPDMIPAIIDAWQNGNVLNETYTPAKNAAQPTLTVSADFAARGAGIFAGYMRGHSHRDHIAKMTNYPKQNIYCFAATANDDWMNATSDLPRVTGEKTEDCITVVAVDKVSRKVKLVRIGSNITFDMVRRDMIAIPY